MHINIKRILSLLALFILFYSSCTKDNCERKDTYDYFSISNSEKQKFPYGNSDTMLWINASTMDTLHFFKSNTLNQLDTSVETSIEECIGDKIEYHEVFTYFFKCIEDSFYNVSHSYRKYYLENEFDNYIYFNKRRYNRGYTIKDTINNYGIIYNNIWYSSNYCQNYNNGLLRITIGNTRLYRIK